MRPFEFVIALVAIVLTYRAFVLLFDRKRKAAPPTDPSVDALESRLSNLEERVGVLERIVTDDKSDLRRQFRDLE
jgi:hypothetical protein